MSGVTPCYSAPEHMHVDDWTRDGKSLLLTIDGAQLKAGLWLLPLDGSSKPSPILNTRLAERDARLSPDWEMDRVPIR